MSALELQNWEIGIMPEVEFKQWNEKFIKIGLSSLAKKSALINTSHNTT